MALARVALQVQGILTTIQKDIGPLIALGSGVVLVISAYYLMRILVRRS